MSNGSMRVRGEVGLGMRQSKRGWEEVEEEEADMGRGNSTAADWEGAGERESVDSEAAMEAFEPHMSGEAVAVRAVIE